MNLIKHGIQNRKYKEDAVLFTKISSKHHEETFCCYAFLIENIPVNNVHNVYYFDSVLK